MFLRFGLRDLKSLAICDLRAAVSCISIGGAQEPFKPARAQLVEHLTVDVCSLVRFRVSRSLSGCSAN